jgi:hypothetical protein
MLEASTSTRLGHKRLPRQWALLHCTIDFMWVDPGPFDILRSRPGSWDIGCNLIENDANAARRSPGCVGGHYAGKSDSARFTRMTESEKTCPECNGDELLIKAATTKDGARRATDVALCLMTDRTPKRYGIRIENSISCRSCSRLSSIW